MRGTQTVARLVKQTTTDSVILTQEKISDKDKKYEETQW